MVFFADTIFYQLSSTRQYVCANQSQPKETVKDQKKACDCELVTYVERGLFARFDSFIRKYRPSRKVGAKSGARRAQISKFDALAND